MDNKDTLLNFLKQQRLMFIAAKDDDVWIASVYYVIDENVKLYFISSIATKHSQQILKNQNIVFSIAWFDKKDHTNRKAIQGKGICTIATKDIDIMTGIKLHNKYFPEFKSRLTPEYIKSKENASKLWTIEPKYIKFWNDELYGMNGIKEFTF